MDDVIAPNPHLKKPRGLAHAKPVKAVGLSGRVFGTFPSVHRAAESMGLWRNSLITAIRAGTRASGYYWRLVDVPDEQQPLTRRDRSDRDQRQPIPGQYRPGGVPAVKPPAPVAVTVVYAPRGRVAKGCAVAAPVPKPRVPSGWKFGEHFADAADSVGSIAPDVTVDETLNPARLGDDPRDIERVRFNRARSYNPALTWADWLVLTTRATAGRKPGTRKVTR